MSGQIKAPLLERTEEMLDGVTAYRLSKRIASVEEPGLRDIILDFSAVNSIAPWQ